MNQSKGNLSRVQSQMIMMDRNRKGGKEELMSQMTMRKSGSAIQIVQRVVSGKDNSSVCNPNNSMKSHSSMMIPNKQKQRMTLPINSATNNRTFTPTSPFPPQQQQDKMQQLKNRFKRIKSSYDQAHHTLVVMESSSSFGNNQSRNSYREGNNGGNSNNNYSYGCYKEEGSTTGYTHNYSDSMARQSSSTVRFGSNSQLQPTLKTTNPNEISFNCDSSLPPSSYRGSQFENQIDMKDKYRSLTKELGGFQNGELIALLVGEMEDNEKNKQLVDRKEGEKRQLVREVGLMREEIQKMKLFIKELQASSSPTNKQPPLQPLKLKQLQQLTTMQQQQLRSSQKQIQKQKTQIQKLKKQLQTKREQIEILLQTEKKNLGIIEKLKRVSKMSGNSASSSNLQQSQQQLQEQVTISNSNNSNNINHPTKTRSFSTILNQQKYPQPLQQKSLSMSHILPSGLSMDNMNMDYKQKHDQLQQYMNEYICSVNHTYDQYQHTLSQVRQLNCQLKEANKQLMMENSMLSSKLLSLSNQNTRLLQQEHNLSCQLTDLSTKHSQLQHQLTLLKVDALKLSTCLSNSKLIIDELQQQFSLLKDENGQLKLSNERLVEENGELVRDLEELKVRVGESGQVEEEIRALVGELTGEKGEQMNVIQQQQGVISQLRLQLNDKTTQLSRLQTLLQTQTTQLTIHTSSLTTTQSQLTQLTHKLQLTTQSNNILEQTVTQMGQLIAGLIAEHKEMGQREDRLKERMGEIMEQVKVMQTAYEWESTHGESMREMLALFWEKEQQQQLLLQNDKLSNSCSNTYSNASSLLRGTSIKNTTFISRTKSQGSAMFPHHLKHNNYLAYQQSCQISFKKASIITKQGSSSILTNNNHHQKQSHISSDIKQSKATSSIQQQVIESSAISHKYYSSEMEEDNFNLNGEESSGECDVLRQASSRMNQAKEVGAGGEGSSNGWKDKMIKMAGHKRAMAQL